MKPNVICHMICSVDGRLVTDRWSKPFDGTAQDEVIGAYYDLENEMNMTGWIIGRSTVEKDFESELFDFEKYPPAKDFQMFRGTLKTKQTAIVIDAKGKTRYTTDKLGESNVIAVLGETVSEEYLAHLREVGISYIFAGRDGNELGKALEMLYTVFGFSQVVLEGGGVINGTFLKAGLIDELSLLIYPGVDGLSGAPSIFEYKGVCDERPALGQALELLSVRELENGVVALRYRFHKI